MEGGPPGGADSAEDLREFDKWLDKDPSEEIPLFLRDEKRSRKSKQTRIVHEMPIRGGIFGGRGRGRGLVERPNLEPAPVAQSASVAQPPERDEEPRIRDVSPPSPFGRGRGRGRPPTEQNSGPERRGSDGLLGEYPREQMSRENGRTQRDVGLAVPIGGGGRGHGRGRGDARQTPPRGGGSRGGGGAIDRVPRDPKGMTGGGGGGGGGRNREVPNFNNGQQARGPAAPNTIFKNYPEKKVESASSNANIVNNHKFKQALMKQQLESSWDRPLTTRNRQISMTDPEFYSTVKTSGNRSEGCDHLVIHSNCYHMEERVMGVCARCYMIFCDENCLKVCISNGKGRIGLASESYLKVPFGIRQEDFQTS